MSKLSARAWRWQLAEALHDDNPTAVHSQLEKGGYCTMSYQNLIKESCVECEEDSSDSDTETTRTTRQKTRISEIDHSLWVGYMERLDEEMFEHLGNAKEEVLSIAARFGCVNVISTLVNSDPDGTCIFVRDRFINSAFRNACWEGQLKAANLLLTDERVDPVKNIGFCLELSCDRGYIGIVKLLLADGRVDPNRNPNNLGSACSSGRTAVVELLLANVHGVTAATAERAFEAACDRSPYKVMSDSLVPMHIVKLLLSQECVDTAMKNKAFVANCKQGNLEMVTLLMADNDVDPSLNESAAIVDAFDHTEVVRLLLTDPRVNPIYSFHKFCLMGNADIVEIMLADSRLHLYVLTAKFLRLMVDACDKLGCGPVVRLLVNIPPLGIVSLFEGEFSCANNSTLRQELGGWQVRSARLMLLCVKRVNPQAAARLSDVLREVVEEFARFNVTLAE